MKESALDKIGIAMPRILFPTENLSRWGVIACDQFTSRPEYWEEAERLIGKQPSSLDLIMPEAWLGDSKRQAHKAAIPEKMKEYMEDGTLADIGEGFMFIHRQMSNGYYRRGLLVLLDLDKYEYAPGNKALCRATEGTVEDRLPARIEIRKTVPLEMPHVMLLINDKANLLMGQLDLIIRTRQPYYETELMQGSGNLKGWFIHKDVEAIAIVKALTVLLGASRFQGGMLYAVGDGNHSLAAAKKCGDKYAMVELVNVYDHAVEFFPIHRLKDKNGNIVDYIHGEEECKKLAEERGLVAEIMPEYPKERLFKDIIKNGVLPAKTFSIGEAVDKRFYMECRALDR